MINDSHNSLDVLPKPYFHKGGDGSVLKYEFRPLALRMRNWILVVLGVEVDSEVADPFTFNIQLG
jgi:hypothetical protein